MGEEKVFPEDYYSLDTEGLGSNIRDMPLMIREAMNIKIDIEKEFLDGRLFIAGMGGSGIAGELLRDYSRNNRVIPVHEYEIKDVTKNDVVVIISYSGNTEEMLSCFKSVINTGAKVLVITSGGRLEKLAKNYRRSIIKLKTGYQPRAALPYMFVPLLYVARKMGIISDFEEQLKKGIDSLIKSDLRKKALELLDKFKEPFIIYGTPLMRSVAYRWKTQFNENAKMAAFFNQIPEMNHNELESLDSIKNYTVVFIGSDKDHFRVRKRISILRNLYERYTSVILFETKEELLISMFKMIQLGDWITYFLGLKKGIDPSKVPIIEGFKEKMGPFI